MSHVIIAVIFLVSLTLSMLALLVLTRDGSKSTRSLPAWSPGFLPTPPQQERQTRSDSAPARREKTTTESLPARSRATSVPGMGQLPEKRILREARTLVQEIELFLDEQSWLG